MDAVLFHAPTLTDDEAELLTGAGNAIRRGRSELLMSYCLAGYYCLSFLLAQLNRKVARVSAIDTLKAVLTPEANTARERDPSYLIRVFGTLNLLSGGEAQQWAESHGKKGHKAPAFVDALSVNKAAALSPLINQPVGTDGFTWARDDAAAARAIFAWACGPDAPTAKDITLRVNYFLDPAKGRQLELSHRLKECKTAQDYDAVIEWARSLGADAALPDGSSVLDAAVAAKARAFPPEPADDPEQEQGEADGEPLGAMSEADLAGADELAPTLTAAITRHRSPDDVFVQMLRLLVASGDLSGTAQRAASAALVILTRGDKAADGLPLPSGAPVPAGAS